MTSLQDIWTASANDGPWPITAPEAHADGWLADDEKTGLRPVEAEGFGGAPAMKCETVGI